MMEHQGEGSDVMSRDKTSQSLQHRMINEQNFASFDSVQCGALRFKYARLVFPSSKIVG